MRRGIIVGLLLIFSHSTPADEPSLRDAKTFEAALQAAIARTEPAVACVQVYRVRERSIPAPNPGAPNEAITPPDYYGSGIVISSTGLVLTSFHLVRDEVRIKVRLPARTDGEGREQPSQDLPATIFAADYRSDLAILKLPPGTYPIVPLGRGEEMKKGSMVLSLGHPFAAGFRDGSASASWGIIGNLRRHPPSNYSEQDRDRPFATFGTLLQTDARLQLGSSGGALIDLDGKLVGVTVATAALTGVESPGGFAIPIDGNARRVIDVLLRGEEVEYGFLGVSTADDGPRGRFRPSLGPGVTLSTVSNNSPAYRAGLREGDVILRINGQPIRERDDMFLALAAGLAGQKAEIQFQRGGRASQTVEVTLAKAFSKNLNRATNRPAAHYGLRVDYSSVIAQGRDSMIDGVVVREVQERSPAKAAGLVEFVDVITKVNGKPVRNPAEYQKIADKAAAESEPLVLTLYSQARTITLQP